jgi:mitochondrial import inner membrane translocase subunit TIM50
MCTTKRPGVEYFFGYLSQFYKVVIVTAQTSQPSISIIEQLDPFSHSIIYYLFCESTHTRKGKVIKDLNYLNRDLSKAIAIDSEPDRYVIYLMDLARTKPFRQVCTTLRERYCNAKLEGWKKAEETTETETLA